MKLYTIILSIFWSISAFSQETVTINVNGITSEICKALKWNGDRISWISNGKVQSNVLIELSNPGIKKYDKARIGLMADPDDLGNYIFSLPVIVKIKNVDKTKPVLVKIIAETIFDNEIFAHRVLDFNKLSDSIKLDGYKWRASGFTDPNKKLCLSFSAFLQDKDLRKSALDNEGTLKFTFNDFSVQVRQDETANWMPLASPIKGSISNGTSVNLNQPWPKELNSEKKIYVRFSAKTKKGNYIWGEYSVEPHEFRKEFRATGYGNTPFELKSDIIR